MRYPSDPNLNQILGMDVWDRFANKFFVIIPIAREDAMDRLSLELTSFMVPWSKENKGSNYSEHTTNDVGNDISLNWCR